ADFRSHHVDSRRALEAFRACKQSALEFLASGVFGELELEVAAVGSAEDAELLGFRGVFQRFEKVLSLLHQHGGEFAELRAFFLEADYFFEGLDLTHRKDLCSVGMVLSFALPEITERSD